MSHNIVVFSSGMGSNFENLILSSKNKIIPCDIVSLICNNKDAGSIQKAITHNIPYHLFEKQGNRVTYYQNIINYLDTLTFDMIILSGWMLIIPLEFLSYYKNKNIRIINLHPALPNTYPGVNAIDRAYYDHLFNNLTMSGVMVHDVIPAIDSGNVICEIQVPIYKTDSLESFSERMHFYERSAMITAINNIYRESTFQNPNLILKKSLVGKVRDCYDMYLDDVQIPYMCIYHSDRLSAFDHHICDIDNKGKILMLTNIWWLNQTNDIIENHYMSHNGNNMVVKKCNPIKLEIVVRGYITGNTKTSLWTHYENGVRNYCGNELPEGLVKNQKLESPLITPTTKGTVDVPISPQNIIDQGILTMEQWQFISEKALQLYNHGYNVALTKGLILVDTKYEFGFLNDKIILIDEIHTPDSSRYWLAETYQEKFNNSQSPDKYDKDCIRDWLCENSNPTQESFIVPNVPDKIKNKVKYVYQSLYDKLCL
jgi:phosphoribosylaminoimidazole-succinocarboxamide synthase